MWITLYSDASFRDGKAGWGIWLRSAHGRIIEQGPCDEWVQDNNAAEVFAVYKAIELAMKAWPDTLGIQVNTDNQVTLRSLWPWSPAHENKAIRRAQDLVRGLAKAHNLKIRTKHVKSHERSDNTRSWLNNRCDKLAGQVTGKYERRIIAPRPESSDGTPSGGIRENPEQCANGPGPSGVCSELRLPPVPAELSDPWEAAGLHIQTLRD